MKADQLMQEPVTELMDEAEIPVQRPGVQGDWIPEGVQGGEALVDDGDASTSSSPSVTS